MRVSELIEYLQELQGELGDVIVQTANGTHVAGAIADSGEDDDGNTVDVIVLEFDDLDEEE